MENSIRKQVTIYRVIFEGLYGRNRLVKRTSGENHVYDHGTVLEPKQLKALADADLATFKARSGVVRVERYADCEQNSYESTTRPGSVIVTHMVPLFSYESVYSARVGK
jgi:hypothetical protein